MFAELKERAPEEIDRELDQIYELRPSLVEQKNFPGNIIANMLNKKLKEDILRHSFDNPIEYDGFRIKILRELPKQILTGRKVYKKLTDKLKKQNLGLRWELPKGLSFMYKGRRKVITAIE